MFVFLLRLDNALLNTVDIILHDAFLSKSMVGQIWLASLVIITDTIVMHNDAMCYCSLRTG